MKRTLTLALALTSGAALATQYPLTLKDDTGRNVTFTAEPQRIVSALPSTTETLCVIGACTKLVGVDSYADFPAQVTTLPKVADLYTPNVEAIVALKPDLVIVSKYGKLMDALNAVGVKTFALNPETYDEVFSKARTLGKIVNREAQARNLEIGMRRDIARVEILTKNARKVSTYLEIDPTPYTVGPNSFMGVMLSKAGAQNIIPAKLGDFPQISPELVVQQNPALILGLDRATAAKRPGWNSTTAVKTGRVMKLPMDLDTILSRPGPRLPQALLGLAKLVHPELFK